MPKQPDHGKQLCAAFVYQSFHHEDVLQDFREEQRAKRRRLLSAAATACIRRGMIRYLQVLPTAVSLQENVPNRKLKSPSVKRCKFLDATR